MQLVPCVWFRLEEQFFPSMHQAHEPRTYGLDQQLSIVVPPPYNQACSRTPFYGTTAVSGILGPSPLYGHTDRWSLTNGTLRTLYNTLWYYLRGRGEDLWCCTIAHGLG